MALYTKDTLASYQNDFNYQNLSPQKSNRRLRQLQSTLYEVEPINLSSPRQLDTSNTILLGAESMYELS